MLGKLKSLLGMTGEALPEEMSYEDSKDILEKGSKSAQVQLASRQDVKPEILYYLADSERAEIRRAIASNPATPLQADEKLVKDEDDEVRGELARKIGRIVPDLNPEENVALRDKAISVLEELAEDQAPKVRALIAEAIKKSKTVPKPIVDQLARDVEAMVCGPILEYSPLLNDDDLREIIAAGTSSFALKAIANRGEVSADISQQIADTLDIPAVAALLTNESAHIREDTLDQIIDQAQSVEDLHKPLALKPQLSIRAMKRIAGFVASALVHSMMENTSLPEEQAEEILDKVRERIQGETVEDSELRAFEEQAQDLFDRGAINDAFVIEQVENGHRELLLHCMALIADLPMDVIRKIILSKSGRAVTALCWRAQLTMRTAYEVQTKLALVPSAQLLSAKNGKDYPLDEDELDWHLSYFIDQA